MTIKARRYSTVHGLSQRDVMLTDAETLEVIRKAGKLRPAGSPPPPPRRPAISRQIVGVYDNARICLECPELARAACGTGYCTIGPVPRDYPALIVMIQDSTCPLGKHPAKD